jgi:hypothetical protein
MFDDVLLWFTGVKKFFCGPESFTPDLAPCVGEAPEIKNYFVAAGTLTLCFCVFTILRCIAMHSSVLRVFLTSLIVYLKGLNSIGILTGGGLGRVVAHWIINGKPDVDVCGFNVDRLHRYQSNPAYRQARVAESLGNVYKCHYPYKVPQTARGAKRTAVFDRVAQQGAYFRAVSGYETADFYETDDQGVPLPLRTLENSAGAAADATAGAGSAVMNAGRDPAHLEYTWGRPSFWKHWEREHRACREGVCLIDMSFMSKFLIQGRDAGDCINR